MALKEFKLPDIGEGIAEGEIVSWKVSAGQAVNEEDEFVEVMTDKATVTITVPFTGSIAELKCAEGDVVPVGSVIAVIDAGAAFNVIPMSARLGGTARSLVVVTHDPRRAVALSDRALVLHRGNVRATPARGEDAFSPDALRETLVALAGGTEVAA